MVFLVVTVRLLPSFCCPPIRWLLLVFIVVAVTSEGRHQSLSVFGASAAVPPAGAVAVVLLIAVTALDAS